MMTPQEKKDQLKRESMRANLDRIIENRMDHAIRSSFSSIIFVSLHGAFLVDELPDSVIKGARAKAESIGWAVQEILIHGKPHFMLH